MFKGIGPSNVIDQDDTVSPSIIGRGQSSKAFLTGRIPNGQFDSFSIHINVFDLEINSNRRLNVIIKGIIRETKQHGRLEYSIERESVYV